MNNWDLIEKKIQKRLSEEEKIILENLLGNDIELRKELDDHLKIQEILEENKRAAEFENYYQSFRKKEKTSFRLPFFLRITSIAASILIFLYFSFTDIYRPDIALDSGLVMQVEKDKSASDLNPDQKKALDNFFAGQFFISNGEFEKAILKFNESIKTKDVRQYFREATTWHLCIAYLKAQKYDLAKQKMNEIDSWENPKYPISVIDKWKLRWQIYFLALFE